MQAGMQAVVAAAKKPSQFDDLLLFLDDVSFV